MVASLTLRDDLPMEAQKASLHETKSRTRLVKALVIITAREKSFLLFLAQLSLLRLSKTSRM